MTEDQERMMPREAVELIQIRAQNAKLAWALDSEGPCDLIDDLLLVCAALLAMPGNDVDHP